jgi:hypothetical protein
MDVLPSLKLLFEIEENSMSRSKRGLTIASTLLLVAVLISACEQPYSTPPAVTNTPIDPNSFFSTPIPSQPGNMQDVENITTQTALASVLTQTPGGNATAVVGATVTPTPIIELNPTATATQAVAVYDIHFGTVRFEADNLHFETGRVSLLHCTPL